MEPIIVPITDVLDLHTFNPGDLPHLIADYLDACLEKEMTAVRIIHGKGQGVLKQRVRSLLGKHPRVVAYADAPTEAGGWGATLVTLAKETDRNP